MVDSPLDNAWRNEISSSNMEQSFTTEASVVQGLHQRLISFQENYYIICLTYRPWCKRLNQSKTPHNTRVSILVDKKTLHPCGNVSSSWLNVAIWTCSNPEKYCIISWWLLLALHSGPSATNLTNCLCIILKWCHWNCYRIILNVVCTIEMTEVLIVIDIVCEVGKSLETPSNLIL